MSKIPKFMTIQEEIDEYNQQQTVEFEKLSAEQQNAVNDLKIALRKIKESNIKMSCTEFEVFLYRRENDIVHVSII